MKILINVKEIYVISFLEKNKLMASLTPTPTSMILIRTTSMIDRIEKYLLSSRGKLRKDSFCSKKHFIYIGNFQKLIYKTILPYLVKKTLCIVLITQKLEILGS